MSSPRDRDGSDRDGSDRDGFEQRPDEGSGWREPGHLGGGDRSGAEPAAPQPPAPQPPASEPPASQPPPAGPEQGGGSTAWQPPGWELPPAAPDRPAQQPPAGPRTAGPPAGGGLFGPRRPRTPGEVERLFAYQGDPVGAQAWAVQQGWDISDGTGPEDAALAELVRTAPVRATRDHRPAGVMRGRYGTLDLVAFDVLFASGRYAVPEYAVTAAPVLGALPPLRLSPARFWRHRTGGLVHVPSGDPAFDTRWVLLAAEDGPAARALVGSDAVRGLLLGTDDGDEFWTAPGPGGGGLAGGWIAAIRPDGHRPQLIEHHARLLTAVVGALAPAL
ncbi:hypothetical protein SAMN06893096_105162 [Geodermatophilus pulveris]|uniref:Uncharacterized protein n=1 Tax=Geodermatophilus pulveris TaxID=1564159 RepID=A0A239FLS6_9ACTN|nr:hypothetical protein [Geodermatophilus pulveris]SNS57886.1 hypothetical protein SAMN06893096_105162 [Geodermatophilus pulveris]